MRYTGDNLKLYDDLPVAVYICDLHGRINYFNKAAIKIWEQPPDLGSEQWCGIVKTKSTNHSNMSSNTVVAENAILDEEVFQEEFILNRPNGQIKNVLALAALCYDDSGLFIGALNNMIDITDLRKNDTRQSMLAAIIESSDDAIITKTLDGTITSWNRAATNMFGYTENEAIGQNISIIIPPDRMDEEKEIIKKLKNGQKIDHFETIRVTKEGKQIYISLSISPMKNIQGEVIGALKVARNISQQKFAEEQMRSYTARLEEVVQERTESLNKVVQTLEKTKADVTNSLEKEKELNQLKSRFVSMASHEFRTPLSALQLSASLIDRYVQPLGNEQINKHVRKIKSAVGTLNGILNDFLSLEKLETGKLSIAMSNFNLVSLCEEVTEELQALAKQGQTIICKHTGTQHMVYLDPGLIKNCLVNLLSNTIKYSGEDMSIELNTTIDDQTCTITVKDHGIGIPEEDQKHLFEAFFRAQNTGNIPGTGLGLNIVSRYVAIMHGHINFESKVNQGTIFTLSFPIRHEKYSDY